MPFLELLEVLLLFAVDILLNLIHLDAIFIVIDQADCSIPTNLISSSIIQPALVGAEFGQAT